MLTFKETLDRLKSGYIVIIPTETVYGLAASIYNYYAIKNIFYFKKRSFYNPLIIHIGEINHLNQVAKNIPNKAWKLVEYFFPGPLTLILEKKKNILNLITCGKNSVAVRMPNHSMTLSLIRKLGFPIVVSSANLSNYLSPTSVNDVEYGLPCLKKYILNGGVCQLGVESTILGFTKNNKVKLLRHGAISIELIENILNEKLIVELSNNDNNKFSSQNNVEKNNFFLKSNLVICDNFYTAIFNYQDKKIGILSFNKTIKSKFIFKQIILSKNNNLIEASKNFFSSLYLLDSLNLDVILVQKFPNIDIGVTLNDRLMKFYNKKI